MVDLIVALGFRGNNETLRGGASKENFTFVLQKCGCASAKQLTSFNFQVQRGCAAFANREIVLASDVECFARIDVA